jgi:predicted DNA-binding protein (MmcQ/YjbR family)
MAGARKAAVKNRAPAKKNAARGKSDAFARLTEFALKFPEATEDHPWGETAIKVRGKIFVFMGKQGLSVKLPRSYEFALEYSFTRPTSHGLGKSRWVSAWFAPGDDIPLDVLKTWIGESYRAVAPKKLAAALD